jgi:hypothetical protein
MMWRSSMFLAAAMVAAIGLRADETKTAEKPPEAPKKRQRVVSDLSGFELLDPSKLKDKPVVAGATRGMFAAKSPVLLAPQLGKLHGASPVFAWKHEAQHFTFVLSNEAGKELHTAQVEGQTYALPADAATLADGKTYSWSVKPAGAPATAAPATAGIVVVTKAERAQIDKALAAVKDQDEYKVGLARGKTLTDKRVWYDAVGVYTDLIARFPDRPEAYEARATLYAQLPASKAASDEDFARADQLAKK